MNYVEYDFTITPTSETAAEILVAELAEVGFESFVDTERGLLAYVQEPLWHKDILNFSPITVGDLCTVRATFHEAANTPYEIIIDPKMSFGTGHHETTYMMLQFLLKEDLSHKKVLDMGCGTSVLAIMAEKRGATDVTAIDIDEWCVENSAENIARNACKHIQVLLGDASALAQFNHFDFIIANINRNILLSDIPLYTNVLADEGILLLSGFYESDMPAIVEKAKECGLSFVENIERNNWVAVKLKKTK